MSGIIVVGKTKRGKVIYLRRCLSCGKEMRVSEALTSNERGKHCSRRCWAKDRPMREVEDRFWGKVDRDGPTLRPGLGQCWEWTAAGRRSGRGRFLIVVNGKRRTVLASRMAYCLSRRVSIETFGLHVLHKCDNPLCCRPEHLFSGTHADNMRDMGNKGRSSTAKLTPEDVLAMRRERARGTTLSIIAKSFGVSEVTVSHVALRKTWKNVR